MHVAAPTKWPIVFLAIFFMCPKRIHLSVPIGNQPEYYHAVRRSSNMKFLDNILPVLRNDIKLKNKEDFIEDEPGLELTDEEISKFKLWDKGVVPYYIDVLSFSDKVLRDRIRWFLNLVNSLTSLNFVELPRPPKDDQTRWVFFVNRRARLTCADHSSRNFTNKGVQPIPLGYDCMNTDGELAEAVLAIAGVPPQHNSPDRDEYITIIEENIIPDKLYLFEKLNDDDWLFGDVGYDFASVGHFHNHKYSANGRATIKTKSHTDDIATEKSGELSNKDILKIKMLYNHVLKRKKQRNKVLQCNKLFVRREPRKGIKLPPTTTKTVPTKTRTTTTKTMTKTTKTKTTKTRPTTTKKEKYGNKFEISGEVNININNNKNYQGEKQEKEEEEKEEKEEEKKQ